VAVGSEGIGRVVSRGLICIQTSSTPKLNQGNHATINVEGIKVSVGDQKQGKVLLPSTMSTLSPPLQFAPLTSRLLLTQSVQSGFIPIIKLAKKYLSFSSSFRSFQMLLGLIL
jgi:hypothetical protein